MTNPQISIGDYTYYDDPEDSENFERNVLYLYPFTGDRLIIGKFCAIATGVTFIMNGANYKMSGFSNALMIRKYCLVGLGGGENHRKSRGDRRIRSR